MDASGSGVALYVWAGYFSFDAKGVVMNQCIATVAAELIRLTLKKPVDDSYGARNISIEMRVSAASPTRTRGAAIYNPLVYLSWGPWMESGVELLDARGNPAKWTPNDAARWLRSALNGVECVVVIQYPKGEAIPPKQTPKRSQAAAKKIRDMDSQAIRDAGEAKRQAVDHWADTDRKQDVQKAGDGMGQSADWLDLAHQMQDGTTDDYWQDGQGQTGET